MASTSALYLLNFSLYSGILFPWKKKMKESQGCAKTLESRISLGARSPLLTPSSHAAISSCLGPINSHLSSQENTSTDENHHQLRITNAFFFQGMILPSQKDLIKKKYGFLSDCFSLKLSESLCLIPSRCLLPLLTTSFFSKGNKN